MMIMDKPAKVNTLPFSSFLFTASDTPILKDLTGEGKGIGRGEITLFAGRDESYST